MQAEILKLMRDLRTRIDSGIVLITHDMGVVADLADRISVMQDGRDRRGQGPRARSSPTRQHPYTIKLLDAVPHLGGAAGSADEVDLTASLAAAAHAEDVIAVVDPSS